jgi:CheY-specific phosphatase CheX
MQVELDEGAIIKASDQFWEQMLAMKLEPTAFPDQFCVAAGHLEASVRFSGVWDGRIEVRMAEKLAHLATAAMLMQPLETVTEVDTLDATKEIANMIAGVIKSSLPRPCAMTVPESVVSNKKFCSYARTHNSVVVAFRHESGDLMVCVSEEHGPR